VTYVNILNKGRHKERPHWQKNGQWYIEVKIAHGKIRYFFWSQGSAEI